MCDTAHPPSGYLGLCSGGLLRIYQIHVPTPQPAGKMPLVVSLHGAGSAANHSLDPAADSAGFLAAYPEGTRHAWGGTGNIWNAGGIWDQATDYTDDVGFIRALIDTLIARYPIDRGRVYVSGFSNGAMLAYRLAYELSSRIAAIWAMSGQELNIVYSASADTVAVMHVHGLNDTEAPYQGGGAMGLVSVPAMLERWRTRNRCAAQPDTIFNADGVVGLRWRTAGGRGDVVLYTHPGGHGGPTSPTTADMGPWPFFKSLTPRAN